MLLGENIMLALRSLKHNKMRSFLTMLGIIIGIASVIAIFTVGNSLTRSVSENMQTLGANDVFAVVSPRSSSEKRDPDAKVDGLRFRSSQSSVADIANIDESNYITADMLHDLSSQFGDKIYAINVQSMLGTTTLQNGRKSSRVSVSGVSAGFFVTNPMEITAGSMFTERELDEREAVCLIDETTAENLYGSEKAAVGKETEITLDGQTQALTIVGVYKSTGSATQYSMFQPDYLYIPLRTASLLSHTDESFQYAQIITGVGVDPEELSSDITSFFEPYYRGNSSYHVTALTLSGMVAMLEKLLSTITAAISIIAGIALLVGGIGVMNIMLVSVTERTREIGTRKALGARNSSIRIQFIVESMIICLIGGVIGLLLGLLMGYGASNYLGYPAQPSLAGIAIAIGFSVGIGLIFGYFPANKAAKMNPIDALRYE